MASKAVRERRWAARGDDFAAIRAKGFEPRIIDDKSRHVRIDLMGASVDYWPTTGRWRHLTLDGRGQDFASLLAYLDGIASGRPPAPKTASRRAEASTHKTVPAPCPIHLTIFADAGFCPQTGAAGWGAWMKGAAGGLTVGGEISSLVDCSTEAEIRALANALAVARSRGLVMPKVAVMVQSDCLYALSWIVRAYSKARDLPHKDGACVPHVKRPKPARIFLEASAGLAEFVRIATELELLIFTRHVRGHQQGEKRQWVNRECDRLASLHLRTKRARILSEGRAAPLEAYEAAR